MKEQKFGPAPVLGVTLGCGLVGFLLRMRMLAVGYDQLGVQVTGSWPYVCLWILSALTLGGLVFLCHGMGQRASMAENLPASLTAAVGGMVAGVMLFVCCLVTILDKPDVFDTLVCALGLAAGALLAIQGYLRREGKASGPVGMGLTLFLALWLVSRFRGWSRDPLLGDYCFQLLACVCAMLASFRLAGFPLEKGRRRSCIFWSMATVYFCCICLADGGVANRLFFTAMALWFVTGSCTLNRPARPRRKLGGGFAEESSHG